MAVSEAQRFERLHPDIIILDEAQCIKNWRTKTADAVKQLRSRFLTLFRARTWPGSAWRSHGAAELVEFGRMPGDLAAQLARVRELTAPPAEGEEPGPPPLVETGEMLIAAVQDVIDLGRQLAAEARL